MILGPLIIVSGPSGSGKSTLIDRILHEGRWRLALSVSATTRQPRAGEKDGEHYFFWTRPQFQAEIQAQGFLEYAEVFGHCYGTLRREVEPRRQDGVAVFLDIDVQGWQQVKARCPEAVGVFVRTSSLQTYEERLRARGTEAEEAIQRRLAGARRELERAHEYDYRVINDDLEVALTQLRAILAPLCEGL